MPQDRDTHFQGYASLLYEEIENSLLNIAEFSFVPDAISEEIKQLIAQRAYDLIKHTLHELGIDEDVPFNDATTPGDIPDLTQWPD